MLDVFSGYSVKDSPTPLPFVGDSMVILGPFPVRAFGFIHSVNAKGQQK